MKDIAALKKDLLEAIKSDPDALDKIPDIIEVAIKRVADIKEEEIKKLEQDKEELEDKLKDKEDEDVKEQEEEDDKDDDKEDDDMKETAARYVELLKQIAKLEQEEKDEKDEEEVKEAAIDKKDEEVAPEEGHDSDVTPPDEARDVGDQPADEGEDKDHPKISRATGKLESLRADLAKLEQKLGLSGLDLEPPKEVDAETGDDPNVKESELEEAVKIAYKKGQEATVEEITKSSAIGQALMAFEKIKEAVFPLIKEDINVEGFEGNVYNLLKEKEKELEDMKKDKEKAEKEKDEMEESMNLINSKLKDLKEEIVAEEELKKKIETVVESIDDPEIRDKALEASKSVKAGEFDTFKTLVETFKSGGSEDKDEKVLVESKDEEIETEEKVKTDQEKINMMKKIAGIM